MTPRMHNLVHDDMTNTTERVPGYRMVASERAAIYHDPDAGNIHTVAQRPMGEGRAMVEVREWRSLEAARAQTPDAEIRAMLGLLESSGVLVQGDERSIRARGTRAKEA